jgi:hypothetical protein
MDGLSGEYLHPAPSASPVDGLYQVKQNQLVDTIDFTCRVCCDKDKKMLHEQKVRTRREERLTNVYFLEASCCCRPWASVYGKADRQLTAGVPNPSGIPATMLVTSFNMCWWSRTMLQVLDMPNS